MTSIGVSTVASSIQFRADLQKICLNFILTGILAAAANNDIDISRECITRIVFVKHWFVAVPLRSAHDGQNIAPVTINIHIAGVELQNMSALVS